MIKRLIKRKTRRRRNHSVWVILQDGHTRVECRIFDVSDGGAKLTCDKADLLLDRFVLTYALTSAQNKACEIVWRRGQTLGIKFVD